MEIGNEVMLDQWEGLKIRIREVLRELESLRVSENGERNRKGWWERSAGRGREGSGKS